MTIRRSARTRNFTTIDNAVFKNNSYPAMGLLVYLLSRPDNWEVNVKHLVNFVKDTGRPTGRDGVYALIDELRANGFIIRSKTRAGGRFAGYLYEVYDTPQVVTDELLEDDQAFPNVPEQDQDMPPFPAQPYTATPFPAETTLIKTDSKQILKTPKKPLGAKAPSVKAKVPRVVKPKAAAVVEAFEAAWKLYPKREGGNPKNKALSAWNARLKEGASVDDMLSGVVRYAAYCQLKGSLNTSYVMQAVRFFGPDHNYAESWAVTAPPSKPRPGSRHVGLAPANHDEPAVSSGGF